MKGNRPFTKHGIILYGCLIFAAVSFLSSCSLSKKIAKQADSILFKDTIISTGHIGISIYEPATNKYWYNYDAEKYFVPASNAKLFTMYAAMKYLGDSLVGLRYQQTDSGLAIYPTGDPTFLNADFTQQPVFNFLKAQTNIMYNSAHFTDALGKGWAWDDYMDPYMVQRSEFPIYSNLISVYNNGSAFNIIPPNIPLHLQNQPLKDAYNVSRTISRKWDSNDVTMATSLLAPQKNVYQIPLVANYYQLPNFLSDTLQQKVKFIDKLIKDSSKANAKNLSKIYSQPTDSLLKPMLYTSDNFFAEQSL
ncbi:MAG: D-alanyl-D-alanine carboxypeptidase, partial [Ferruginibacter sp.]|nr:D-alanyl-D-alanine carboxypeptidase [Ferruginibacter sp.]